MALSAKPTTNILTGNMHSIHCVLTIYLAICKKVFVQVNVRAAFFPRQLFQFKIYSVDGFIGSRRTIGWQVTAGIGHRQKALHIQLSVRARSFQRIKQPTIQSQKFWQWPLLFYVIYTQLNKNLFRL